MDQDDARAVLGWRGLEDASRLYRLESAGGSGDPLARLLPEAWTAEDALELWTLSRDATLVPQALQDRRLTLWTRLATGTGTGLSLIASQKSVQAAQAQNYPMPRLPGGTWVPGATSPLSA